MRTSIFGLMAATCFTFSATTAQAQDAGPANTEAPAGADAAAVPSTSSISVSANVALTSDYRFRGVSFSDGDFAVQGGVDVSHESGFYVGAWASSIEDSATFGSTELDLYGGWSGEVSSGITADVGLLYYVYPNGEDGIAGPSDYFEPYASLSGTVGPAQLIVGAAYALDGQSSLGNRDNLYLYTDLGVGVPNTPLTVTGHIGYTDGVLSFDSDDTSFDYGLGVDYAVTSNITASAKYVAVQGPTIDGLTDDTVVFTIGASF